MMKKDIYKFPGLMLALLTGSSLFAQTIHNNGARIVSQSETYRVIDNGNFTLKSESSTDLATFANLRIEEDASFTITPNSYLTVSGILTNNSGTDGLVLQSTVDGTASLIQSSTSIAATAQETIISIIPEATQDFDLEFDSYFMAGFAPMFYSTSQGKLFALNSLPELTDELVVPMGFVKNQNSSFSIQLTQNTTDHTLFLEDLKNNVIHNISETPYTFLSAAGDNPNRFLLKFGPVGIDETPVTPVISAWYFRGILNVKTNEGLTNMGIFNIQGQQLQNYQLFGSGLQSVSINLPTGVYFARLVNDGNMQTVKIIIQ